MNPLVIEATEDQPTVVFDAKQNTFELLGRFFRVFFDIPFRFIEY